ncbi:hypothetical protein C6Y55_09240 [Stenotrophomonas maltophilia]|nr:hypothetical protein C6Y55_09240 [Stenotrophomonas maltophilia]
MHPFNADLSRFEADVERHALANADSYATSVLQVLEGERIVRSERLESTSFAPGDLFEEIDNEGKSRYFLNVRAECDCVIRGKPKDALLYLLKGRIEKNLDVNHDMGNINEKDNEAIVFGMMDGQTFRFGFRDLVIRPWNELADKRKARLLSPFITRVVQRYAAYSQRPGLPRIPAAVLPIREDGPADEATGDHASPVCSSCTDQCAAEDATSQENSAA